MHSGICAGHIANIDIILNKTGKSVRKLNICWPHWKCDGQTCSDHIYEQILDVDHMYWYGQKADKFSETFKMFSTLYPVETCWTHCEHRQQMTKICPAIKCWIYFKYVLLCDQNMPSGQMLSTFWMFPVMWLQCIQQLQGWAHFERFRKFDHNVPSCNFGVHIQAKNRNVY